jgi:hypothetical protein
MLGMLCTGFFTASLFFFRFWRETRDRLFVYFGIAFVVMAANQLALELFGETAEFDTVLYGIRLAAFLLIIFGILEKNRSQPTR